MFAEALYLSELKLKVCLFLWYNLVQVVVCHTVLSPSMPSFIPRSPRVGLWWIKWHLDRFFSEYFGFPLSVSFYRCIVHIFR
jgi:hypothetical protein